MNQPEKREQAQIIVLTRSLGGRAWVIGTRRPRGDFQGTCQTPGIPDLWLWFPQRPVPFGVAERSFACWWETKAPNGRLSAPQIAFGDACVISSTPYGFGTLNDYIAFLIERGRLRADQVGAHHVQPSHRRSQRKGVA